MRGCVYGWTSRERHLYENTEEHLWEVEPLGTLVYVVPFSSGYVFLLSGPAKERLHFIAFFLLFIFSKMCVWKPNLD